MFDRFRNERGVRIDLLLSIPLHVAVASVARVTLLQLVASVDMYYFNVKGTKRIAPRKKKVAITRPSGCGSLTVRFEVAHRQRVVRDAASATRESLRVRSSRTCRQAGQSGFTG